MFLLISGSRVGPQFLSLRKNHRRAWSSKEKDAVWWQLGQYITLQRVPGKEACVKALDTEPVLGRRDWRDVKNLVYNAITTCERKLIFSWLWVFPAFVFQNLIVLKLPQEVINWALSNKAWLIADFAELSEEAVTYLGACLGSEPVWNLDLCQRKQNFLSNKN